MRVKKELADDRASFIAAGVAFYLLMGLVPTIGAVVAIYGIVADASDVTAMAADLEGVVPPEALDLIREQMVWIASQDDAAGFAALLGIGIAIWGASKAIDAMMISLNVAYDEKETRGFLRRKFTGLALTFGLALFVVVAVALLVAAPVALEFVGLGKVGELAINILRWPALFVAASLAIAALYRWAPSRATPEWRWISIGSVVATFVWLAASAGFSWYASAFGNYNESYGSLGAVILLLFWFYLTGFAIILGAEINAEIEHQTVTDTTTGMEEPLGERGAHVADTVGEVSK